MLTEQETRDFLALLLAFQRSTHASCRMLAALFGVTARTMSLWLRAAHGQPTVKRLFHYSTDGIKQSIERMNTLDAEEGVYAIIVAAYLPAAKRAALDTLLKTAI